jgi:hypothetical protein
MLWTPFLNGTESRWSRQEPIRSKRLRFIMRELNFDLVENKEKSNVRWDGWILTGIFFLVIAAVLPSYIRARTTRSSNACVNNLRQIDAAKQQWGLENGKAETAYPISGDEITPYLGRGPEGTLEVYCPEDPSKTCSNSYTLGDLLTKPRCRINPSQDS